MFGWFPPKSPCDPSAKRWIEDLLQLLAKQFGLHVLLEKPVVLPTSEFFPDKWDGTEAAVKRMFDRVCGYMNVARNTVELKIFNDTSTSNALSMLDPSSGFAAGTWQGTTDRSWGASMTGTPGAPRPDDFGTSYRGSRPRSVVRLERSMLDRPSDLVGTMAHELAHERLLGEGRSQAHAFDNELLTDLTATYHGFGVFLANNPRKSTGQLDYWPGTKLRRPEYLSEPMLAYAMAHIAWFRDEPKPAWAKHLRWAPRAAFNAAHRYLERTADSTFKPVRLR